MFKAYRIDFKRYVEFHSVEGAARFFKVKPITIQVRSSGGTHLIGQKLNSYWLVFRSEHSTHYIQNVVNDFKKRNLKS